MRFQIARAPWLRPVLAVLGATEAGSFIDVEFDAIDIRFGFFHQRIARRELGSVSVIGRAPWYAGLGWRTNLNGRVGLIGARVDLVRIELTSSRWMFVGVPVRAHELVVCVEHPAQFIEAVRSHALS